MTRRELRARLDRLASDIDYTESLDGFRLTVLDFDGWTDEYDEIIRPLDNPDGVDSLLFDIEREGERYDDDRIMVYSMHADFDRYTIEIERESEDI